MSAVVFLGPSRPVRIPPGVEVRPPAGSGDVLAAAQAGARWIGLVDGRFHQVLAVSPTELRQAAAAGAHLFGAASLGALRACDCPDVMEGIGQVWAGFRAGRLRGEDEVACAWLAEDGRMIAWPLVSIRSTAAAMVTERLLDADAARRGIRALQRRCYLDRDDRAIERTLGPDLLRRLRAGEDDVKRRDAERLLDRLAGLAAQASGAPSGS